MDVTDISLKTVSVWKQNTIFLSFLDKGHLHNLLNSLTYVYRALFKRSTLGEMGDLTQRMWKFDSCKDM